MMYPFFKDIIINNYHSDSFHKTPITPKRITADFELEFYTTDNGFSYVDGKMFPHKIGNVLLARPGQTRYSKGSFVCYSAHFDCDDASVCDTLLKTAPVCCYLPEAKSLFEELDRIPTNPKGANQIHAHAVIMQILAKIHESYPQSDMEETSLKNAAEIKKICDIIKENYAQNNLSIESLYKNTFISRSSFFASFKSVTGLTPSAYINSVRTEHAKILLESTDKPLSYIASECGFGSQSYFSSVFHSQTKMTPLAYRNTYLAEIEKRYK